MEDRGWDPYAESRATFQDLDSFFEIDLPNTLVPDPKATHWRIGLFQYSHIVEMDAPYEVLTNLLRFRINEGYSPYAFHKYLTSKQKKRIGNGPIPTYTRINIIRDLSVKAQLPELGTIFDDFYDNRLRNAIAHSDYILTHDSFRCRGGSSGSRSFHMPYDVLESKLVAAKAFIVAFCQVEQWARRIWGRTKQKAIPYDPHLKGLMEVLVDTRSLMCGFRVHWPNGIDSTYRRIKSGIEMVNCDVDPRHETVALVPGLYVSNPGQFSPLVEDGVEPIYSQLDNSKLKPAWSG